jgi:hypothetical protein
LNFPAPLILSNHLRIRGFCPDRGSKKQRNNSGNNSEITAAEQRDNSEGISDKKATDQRLIRNATPLQCAKAGHPCFSFSRSHPKTWMAGPSPATGGFLMPIAGKLHNRLAWASYGRKAPIRIAVCASCITTIRICQEENAEM